MALKDSLLAASLGATMIAGTNAETKETAPSSIISSQTQKLSPAEVQEMHFQKNYRHLYNNVDGAWFSFGDEKKMRQALYDIGSFAMGHEIIAGIPENMEFGSSNFVSNKYGGSFVQLDNALNINTSYVDEQRYDKRGTKLGLRDILFHELLHAYQNKQGITLVDNYPSVDEILHAQKLIEAETAAWNSVLETTANISSTNSYSLQPQEVRDLVRRDLVAEKRKEWEKNGMGKEFDASQEAYFKKTNSVYRLQQALIASKGNYNLAQKKMVGQEIKLMMNEEIESDWSKSYNEQALRVLASLCLNKKISEHGNPVAYQKMLNYYKKNYGLNPQDIPNTQLTTEYANTIAHVREQLNKRNLYVNPPYSPSSRIAQRRGGGR